MHASLDEQMMARALALAARGRGWVEPNPLVGCVIAKEGRVIGQGFHERFGGPHAEPNALAACSQSPVGATAYTTLEPCCHTNKKTPPCVPRLIEARLARIVVGCLDPSPQVSGAGVRQLREAGIAVTVGVLEAPCRQMLAPFVARIVRERPYVTLKWAVSADGKIAGRHGHPIPITNERASAAVHALRGRCDAIAIGTNTLVNDDPLLNARTPNPPRQPLRIVLSNRLRFPLDRRLFQSPEAGPVLIYTAAPPEAPEAAALRALGVDVIALPGRDNQRGEVRFAMADVYRDLAQRGATHLLVEPGAKLARELMARNQADRAWLLRGQVSIGDEGIDAAACTWPEVGEVDLDGDRLAEHLNPASDCFFASEPSADFLLAAQEPPLRLKR